MLIVKKIRIKLRSFNIKLLKNSILEILNLIKSTNAVIKGPIPLPTKIQRFDLLRSPHVDKKSYDQFEIRTHNRLIDIVNFNNKTIDLLMRYELPSGIDIQIKFK